MNGPFFEWDLAKAASNLAKHGVTFEEASTAFPDPLAKVHADPDHSHDEDRGILIAHSERGRLMLVSFAYRGSRIRIISARLTTRHEREKYEEDSD
jgi:uncharacterized DUF497 family protein